MTLAQLGQDLDGQVVTHAVDDPQLGTGHGRRGGRAAGQGDEGVGRTLEATLEEMIHTIHAHPTLSEAAFEATLAALGQAIHI